MSEQQADIDSELLTEVRRGNRTLGQLLALGVGWTVVVVLVVLYLLARNASS